MGKKPLKGGRPPNERRQSIIGVWAVICDNLIEEVFGNSLISCFLRPNIRAVEIIIYIRR